MPELAAMTAAEAITVLHARLCADTAAVKDPPKFLEALFERYRLAPIAIAADIALPHARTDAVDRMVLAVGRSSRGIPVDAAHGQVRLIFLIGLARHQVSEYLQFVAALSRLLKSDGVRAALLTAANEDELRAPLARAMKVIL